MFKICYENTRQIGGYEFVVYHPEKVSEEDSLQRSWTIQKQNQRHLDT